MSKIEQVRQWFRDNPYHITPYKDLQFVYGLNDIQMRDILKLLRKEGLIESGPCAWAVPKSEQYLKDLV